MVARKKNELPKKNYFEKIAWSSGVLVAGVDEVGRGCLAGPVVAAAVIIPPFTCSRLLQDSKILSEQERLKSYAWIIEHCVYALGIMHHRHIDQYNIYGATLHAMHRAVQQLFLHEPLLSRVLVDAMPVKLTGLDVFYAPFGEIWSSSIAAASIVAKVTRDALMTRLDTSIPGYCLRQHKGYSTPLHKNLITRQNCSIMHRKSFLKNIFFATTYTHDDKEQ